MLVRSEEDENKRPQVRLVWHNLEAKGSCSLIATFSSSLPLPGYSVFLCDIGCLSQKWKFGLGFIAFAFSFVWVFSAASSHFVRRKETKVLIWPASKIFPLDYAVSWNGTLKNLVPHLLKRSTVVCDYMSMQRCIKLSNYCVIIPKIPHYQGH